MYRYRLMKISYKRRCIQVTAAVLYNCNFKGFAEGHIYRGDSKGVCVPGLNCYSCPGAVGACPLGSLQGGLLSAGNRIPYYVLGTILLFGLMLGRFICGFLCPFGLVQDLISKIPVKKIKKNKVTRVLSYLKYVILAVFVVFIPLAFKNPGFCKFICPAGTLEGGIPLLIKNESLRSMIGFLFSWKCGVLVFILVMCAFCHRAFCRFLCPLGALYSLFNPISVYGIKVDESKCIGCGKCVRECKMDVKKVCDRECIQCGKCAEGCPKQAIKYGLHK